jgi:hypothetical protein
MKGGGAKSYYGEKAWSSINHSLLSEFFPSEISVPKAKGRLQQEDLKPVTEIRNIKVVGLYRKVPACH